MASKELTALSIANSQKTPTSVGMETVAETVKRAQDLLKPTISANELTNPTPTVTPPVPNVNTNTGVTTAGIVNNVATDLQQTLGSDLEARKKADEYAALLGADQTTGQEIRNQYYDQFGVTADMQRRKDILNQIAKSNEASNLQKVQIQSGGQGAIQGQRSITQEDREQAVRTAGLAAEASILQGNIETASTLINQAMSDYYSDRQMQNANMIQQLNYYSGIADEQTKQLLQREQRKYEEDQAKVQRVQKAIDSALTTGAATTKEVAMLTDPKTTDSERLALAQLIQARGATEVRNLEMQSAQTDLAIKAKQLAKLREPVVATRETSVIDVNGNKQLIDTQTGEVIASFGPETSLDEIELARDTNFVNNVDILKTHPGLNSSVGALGITRVGIADAIIGEKTDFIGSVESVIKQLTLNTYEEAKAKGMTFGAMSQGEWDILGQAATKIAGWRKHIDDNPSLAVSGYGVSEKAFKKELDTIANFGKMNALRKGANPADIGVQVMDDGTYWSQNSDGTYTQLTVKTQ